MIPDVGCSQSSLQDRREPSHKANRLAIHFELLVIKPRLIVGLHDDPPLNLALFLLCSPAFVDRFCHLPVQRPASNDVICPCRFPWAPPPSAGSAANQRAHSSMIAGAHPASPRASPCTRPAFARTSRTRDPWNGPRCGSSPPRRRPRTRSAVFWPSLPRQSWPRRAGPRRRSPCPLGY